MNSRIWIHIQLHMDQQATGFTLFRYTVLCTVLKEYILVRARTAPPGVFQTFAHPTTPPPPPCSVKQSGSWSILQAEQGEVG